MTCDHILTFNTVFDDYLTKTINLNAIGQTVKFSGKKIVDVSVTKTGRESIFNNRDVELYETKGGNFCLFVSHHGKYVMFIQGKDKEEIRKNSLLRGVLTVQVINKILDISERVVIEVE